MLFKKRLLYIASAIIAATSIAQASYADSLVEAVPNGWRLQRYVGGQVFLYYAGSPCVDGFLRLAGTDAEAAEFWSLILTARAEQKMVGIYYSVTGSGTGANCVIGSFYLKE